MIVECCGLKAVWQCTLIGADLRMLKTREVCR